MQKYTTNVFIFRYKLWADECAKMFGGLDILCVEAIQTGDGKEYVIEVLKICFAYLKNIPSRKKYTE
jgi:hypothetical protein